MDLFKQKDHIAGQKNVIIGLVVSSHLCSVNDNDKKKDIHVNVQTKVR